MQIKCDQYWPGRGSDTYGMIQVILLDTIELATFCVRTFSLHKVSWLLLLLFSLGTGTVCTHSTHRAQHSLLLLALTLLLCPAERLQ